MPVIDKKIIIDKVLKIQKKLKRAVKKMKKYQIEASDNKKFYKLKRDQLISVKRTLFSFIIKTYG
jgi:hypothetical protein